MLKTDYLTKMIAQFKAALELITKLKNENNSDGAITVIDDTFKDLFRLNSMFFHSFSDENLVEILKTNGILETDKCIIIAKLLEEKAEAYASLELNSDSFYTYLKSLNLFLEAYLSDSGPELADYFQDINTIIDKIENYELPDHIKNKLFSYYFMVGSYDKTEDILYDLLETSNNNKLVIDMGANFYQKLLALDDESLENGGLPRDEVEDGLSNLKEKY